MSLHGRFKDEADFRDKFVKPLLNRLGFYGVEEQHGQNEFGKDFVFSELHRLGGMRHYAAQVKYEETINQGAKVTDLLAQVQQAFQVTFRRGESPRDCHVSSVYVFNSGEITSNARTIISSALTREHYGDNVHFLDGDRLEQLDHWATYQSDRDTRRQLLSLRRQLKSIREVWEPLSLEDVKKSTLVVSQFFTHGIESYLSYPLTEAPELYDMLFHVWDTMGTSENLRRYIATPFGVNNEVKAKLRGTLASFAKSGLKFLDRASQLIDAELKKLEPSK